MRVSAPGFTVVKRLPERASPRQWQQSTRGRKFSAFAEKWDARFPSIRKSWRSRWEQVIPFFAYPQEIRRVIHTANAIESINASIRKVTKRRGAFPKAESIRKVTYLAIQKASEHWTVAIGKWPQALSHFAIVFGSRVPR
ncbi:MAG: transposase [Candidatus Eisenbacteria bacterium]